MPSQRRRPAFGAPDLETGEQPQFPNCFPRCFPEHLGCDMSRAQPSWAMPSLAGRSCKRWPGKAIWWVFWWVFWRWWGWVQSKWGWRNCSSHLITISLIGGKILGWKLEAITKSEAAFPNLSQLPEGGLKLSYACESPTPHGESTAKAARKTSRKPHPCESCVCLKNVNI